ncbi:5-demethoxyubiquinol-8 5-hydroxylase UbiM [Moraxella nasovis]|uniref:5-demethoxyubiquinol-8 5-hydroxylase UbiM n=1 Tax=Moraxella nasovis TaxID=2904121 RepID=UPI001F617B11|nr:5-demethoxyubiquinol-8 5-hydroxylase UbiM [Moraxella nasovis]UNU73818.1 5-demethoxyubiquinol-8 5-hydroxylase UbiM [Moraxella nasovis]
MNHHSDIIVIGAGPAGLAFACQFKNSDLRITVLEKAPLESIAHPAYDGREIALTHKSKEILQNLGVWQRFNPKEIYKLHEAKVYNGDFNYALHFKLPKDLKALSSIDRLGNLISNHNIRQALYDEVKELPNVTIITDTTVKSVQTSAQQAFVTLDNGDTYTSDLLVGADSRMSFVRRQLGIGADMNDFGRIVMVFRVSHPLSNEATAQECFLYGRTLALLPLHDNLTNCVITIDNTQADSLLSLSDEELAAEVQRMMSDKLGKITLAGTVHHYPLMGVHAKTFVSTRAALIGDSAVGMHPVTAHGFNLGLLSTETLSNLILNAHQKGDDIGSSSLLRRYNHTHQLHTRPLYHGTNAMVSLFTDDKKPMKMVRDVALRVSNHLPPLKRWIAGQLTGK